MSFSCQTGVFLSVALAQSLVDRLNASTKNRAVHLSLKQEVAASGSYIQADGMLKGKQTRSVVQMGID